MEKNVFPTQIRYLGCLRLLCYCSRYVPQELAESIEAAIIDACEADETLTYRKIGQEIFLERK